ncbi:hypothetical protein GCM10009810_39220 [Nostocoides vanveenii]|uniref:Mutator family transposase n=1 Tax=Nostocoides vanveenii TaxID=330835 RepID=A0ABP4XHH5_9MICO
MGVPPACGGHAGLVRSTLHRVYGAIFIDAIYVKVRDGQVGNQPFYAAVGVDLHGHRDVLGVWPGTGVGGESAKYWLNVLTELKNKGRRGRVLQPPQAGGARSL